MGAFPHVPWTPTRWPWPQRPAGLQMHSGFPARPRGSGAEVSAGARGSVIGRQHPPGPASGARRRGMQRRAGRGRVPAGPDVLRGAGHGVWLPQVYRLSGTDPGVGRRNPAEAGTPRLFHCCEPVLSQREGGSAETLFVSSASSPFSGAAGAAEANPVEGRACGPDSFSG